MQDKCTNNTKRQKICVSDFQEILFRFLELNSNNRVLLINMRMLKVSNPSGAALKMRIRLSYNEEGGKGAVQYQGEVGGFPAFSPVT